MYIFKNKFFFICRDNNNVDEVKIQTVHWVDCYFLIYNLGRHLYALKVDLMLIDGSNLFQRLKESRENRLV